MSKADTGKLTNTGLQRPYLLYLSFEMATQQSLRRQPDTWEDERRTIIPENTNERSGAE